MDFAERMCDHITMLDKGKVILNGALSDIKAKYSQRNVSIRYQGIFLSLNPAR